MKRRFGRKMDFSSVCNFIIIAVFVTIFFVSLIVRPLNLAVGEKQVVVTVTDKGIKASIKGSKYLVYTQDEAGNPQVFQITDNLFKWRFDSADVYAQIKENTKYTFTVCGSRVYMLSWFPNIYKFKEYKNGREIQ